VCVCVCVCVFVFLVYDSHLRGVAVVVVVSSSNDIAVKIGCGALSSPSSPLSSS